MDDRTAADPARTIRTFRTYREAMIVKETLRRWGIPADQVHLRVRGLQFERSQDRMLLFVACWGAAAFAAHLPLGLLLYAVRGVTWGAPVTLTLAALALMPLAWWVVLRYSPDPMAGYAVPQRVDVVVTERYADQALHVLSVSKGRP
jgi:hypothetical protein